MSYKQEFLNSCLILDTETTGKEFQTAEIIESGFVIRENNEWTMFQELHKPVKTDIPPMVSSICYITNSMVKDSTPFIEYKDIFQEVINGYKNGYLVAHNSIYDMNVLKNHGIDFAEHNWICTWRISKKLFNGVADIESTSLPYLRFALGLDVPIELRCHRAGNDSFITGKLLEILVDLMESSEILELDKPYGPQIYNWASQPIIYERMSFGKYKNVLMKDIPKDYWMWALNNFDSLDDSTENFDPDLAASINYALSLG